MRAYKVALSVSFVFIFFLIVNSITFEKIKTDEGAGVVLNFKPKELEDLVPEHIQVNGFEFVEKFPRPKYKGMIYKIPRGLKPHWNLWYLDYKRGAGEITLTNFQLEKTKPRNVVVDITYHVSSYDRVGLIVSGIRTDSGEVEEEALTAVVEPSLYCRKLVFLGDVDEIKITAFVKSENEFAVVDDINVSVGSTVYDNEEEFTCSVRQTEKV